MKIKTFIFVHDQKIILDFLSVKKFEILNDVTYIFVGDNPTNEVENLSNVVICKNLPYNREEYPKLTSYTGWYAIWKNNLHKDYDIINLFEYDINLSENFIQKLEENINYDIIGYIPLSVHHVNYVKDERLSGIIKNSIFKHYNINILNYINNLPNLKTCSVTSNHSFKTKIFEEYMEWVEPIIEDIKLSYFSGHEVERSISLFYLLNNKSNIIIQNVLSHFQFNSHKTQSISADKFINGYKELLK